MKSSSGIISLNGSTSVDVQDGSIGRSVPIAVAPRRPAAWSDQCGPIAPDTSLEQEDVNSSDMSVNSEGGQVETCREHHLEYEPSSSPLAVEMGPYEIACGDGGARTAHLALASLRLDGSPLRWSFSSTEGMLSPTDVFTPRQKRAHGSCLSRSQTLPTSGRVRMASTPRSFQSTQQALAGRMVSSEHAAKLSRSASSAYDPYIM